MRAALVAVVVLGGCLLHRSERDDSPPPGGDPPSGSTCRGRGDCASNETCARNHVCWPTGELREIHASWTLRGAPASATTCATAPNDLSISFYDSEGSRSDNVSYTPLACAQGKFTIDLLPPTFNRVAISRQSGDDLREAVVDSNGNAFLDLSY
jgi:hypothetical protein